MSREELRLPALLSFTLLGKYQQIENFLILACVESN